MLLRNDMIEKSDITFPETIGDFVSGKPCLTVGPENRANVILNIMTHSGKRIAAVVDNSNRFQGLLTRSALLGRFVIDPDFNVEERLCIRPLHNLVAAEVMIPNPVVLPSEIDLQSALDMMTDYGLHTLPVLSDDARLVGMVEMGDLVRTVQVKNQKILTAQESLLSYFMGHEGYGGAGQAL